MKKLLNWGAVGLLTTAILDPLIYGGLGATIPWGRDLLMAGAGIACFYFLFKYHEYL